MKQRETGEQDKSSETTLKFVKVDVQAVRLSAERRTIYGPITGGAGGGGDPPPRGGGSVGKPVAGVPLPLVGAKPLKAAGVTGTRTTRGVTTTGNET